MSEGRPPPVVPTREQIPPRPDLQPVARVPLFYVFLGVFGLAIVFSVLAVVNLVREPDPLPPPRPTASVSATPTPTLSPSPSITPRNVDGAYRFINRSVTGAPVRWDPCGTITYAVNSGSLPPGSVRPDLQEAIRRITAATGIRFESVGTTRETFFSAYNRMRYHGVIRKAELIVIWLDHEGYLRVLRRLQDPRPSLAFAKPMAGLYANRDQYFGGIIVIDADTTSVPGFGFRYARGLVLLHELGHIMGLAHVRDRDQLLYSGPNPNLRLRGFGVGDREGLRQLGEEAGCFRSSA
jgi:hypothetical protein